MRSRHPFTLRTRKYRWPFAIRSVVVVVGFTRFNRVHIRTCARAYNYGIISIVFILFFFLLYVRRNRAAIKPCTVRRVPPTFPAVLFRDREPVRDLSAYGDDQFVCTARAVRTGVTSVPYTPPPLVLTIFVTRAPTSICRQCTGSASLCAQYVGRPRSDGERSVRVTGREEVKNGRGEQIRTLDEEEIPV